ncbi:MAG: glycyl-radical enzyme activating protein, partial [Synergistaceae bacterium]|nr:glycyl-radical enzyme activating protein [Synergistaceae bacterium]
MDHIDYSSSGVIFDIQRFSIHDGPGIRTIVFMKGCPLSCLWCSNPESQQLKPTIMFRADYCIHCGRCLTSCPSGALSVNNEKLVDRAKCAGCGECANVCPTGALVLKGKTVTAAQTVKELKKDAITFRRSRGGITFSGGEPLVQHGFLLETLKACKEQGWHTAMETTGYA